ncbi:hypothetical protein BH11PSE4_BH11PSE4_25470 [soil metagenome]
MGFAIWTAITLALALDAACVCLWLAVARPVRVAIRQSVRRRGTFTQIGLRQA